ncbi:glycosyltransferase family 4 protein [Pseudomonas sp. NMS19W]|uniref:glycosyltransferase family 4 protein n=1 Tax=Pseudomonas sp. NMS19W TaxID=3079768 RepID=UPI003F655DA7
MLVAPPLSDSISIFDYLSDAKFYGDCGLDPNKPAVARFRAGRIENAESFIRGVICQWDPNGLIAVSGNDIGGDLRKVVKHLRDNGRFPILIIEAFHQAVTALTWDVGTALRQLEHNYELRTVVELPVKLSTLRSRWAVEKDGRTFLASEFGQGHTTLFLGGYQYSEVESVASSLKLDSWKCEMVFELSGGIPDLTNWLIRESQYCQTPAELLDCAEAGAEDICYRFFKWLDAPFERSFTRTIASMYNNESMEKVFATLNYHDWKSFLLKSDGTLISKLIGHAAVNKLLVDAHLNIADNLKLPSETEKLLDDSKINTGGEIETIVVAATCWGVKYGGINSFNLEFCRSLITSKSKNRQVICIVPTQKDIFEPAGNVEILPLRLDAGSEFYEFDVKLALDLLHGRTISYVVGHDLKTGDFACSLATKLGARSIAFCHMSYAAYYSMMNSSEESEAKVEKQRQLLGRADIVVGVGPKLVKHAKSLLRIVSSKAQLFEYVPSLLQVQPAGSPRDIPCITYIGRLGQGSELVKQGLLAVTAIGVAIKECKSRDVLVRVIGSADADDENQFKDVVNEKAERLVSTEFLKFSESRADTLRYILDSSIVVMPSVHDGFGLVGWEAISLGIPLVISENTGLYEYLTDVGLQGYVGGVDISGSMGEPRINDVESLSKQIMVKLKDPQKAHYDAAFLLSKIVELKLDPIQRFSDYLDGLN